MCFKKFKGKSNIKNISVLAGTLLVGGILGITISTGMRSIQTEPIEKANIQKEQPEENARAELVKDDKEETDGSEINGNETEENKIDENGSEEIKEPKRNLNALLAQIHKGYIYDMIIKMEDHQYGLPNYYAEDRLLLTPENLEEVYFYENTEGTIYFIPVSMANKTIQTEDQELKVCEHHDEDRINLYLYSYEIWEDELELERAIYPEPDKQPLIFAREVQTFLEELRFLGEAKVPFPKDIPAEAGKLYENEYTDAVMELIHTYFYDEEKYGDYQVYFGTYMYRNAWGNPDYKILISVAIKGEETSYWWDFRAKDILDENGEVVLESTGGEQHSFPAEYDKDGYDYYAPEIDRIVKSNRLMIPLTITENDEVGEIDYFKDEDDLNTIHFYVK